MKPAKAKITNVTNNSGKPRQRRRKVFLVVKDPLLSWLEARADARQEPHLQPTIEEKLRKQYEIDTAAGAG